MPVRATSLLAGLFVLIASPAFTQGQPATPKKEKPTSRPAVAETTPMEFWGPRPIVRARINGEGPFRFIVDLGTSPAVVLDQGLVKQLGLSVPAAADSATDDDDASVPLKSVSVGNVKFADVSAELADLRGFTRGDSSAPDGILGLALFEDYLLTLDYPAREVRLESGSLPWPDRETLEYSPDKEHDYGVTIPVTVGGVSVKAHIDTGSPGFVTLLTDMQEKIPLKDTPRVIGRARTPTGESEIRAATLDGVVKIASHEFAVPTVEFADLGPMKASGAGNVGSRLLSELSVTLDQKHRRVRLHRPAAEKKP